MVQFPEQFRWGTATASYQIEGAVHADGRGESIWDRYCAIPGNVLNNDTGAVACDHYHRYREDVQMMHNLGLHTYRFSIAWPRILPTGRGQVNSAGLDFYDRLIDTLLKADIEPFVTLYHWDLPQTLQGEVGGWASRETAAAFGDYVDIVSRRLGDRVQHWITLNEPYVSAFYGHESGIHAPGIKDAKVAWQVSHHLLLAHGLAVPILRSNGNAQTRVGITLNLTPFEPATSSEDDQLLAQFEDGKMNRWFLDPLFKGSYPTDVLDLLSTHGNLTPNMQVGDAEIIARPIDFLGINYYFRSIISQRPQRPFGDYEQISPAGADFTEMGWEIYPPGIHTLLVRLHQDYSIPALYVTESGAAFADTIGADGQVHDPRRVQYLREHFLQAHAAISKGVPLKGYFVWSLMDNFEWSLGYSKRFGLVYIDYPTQQRILKDSAHWYSNIIAANGPDS